MAQLKREEEADQQNSRRKSGSRDRRLRPQEIGNTDEDQGEPAWTRHAGEWEVGPRTKPLQPQWKEGSEPEVDDEVREPERGRKKERNRPTNNNVKPMTEKLTGIPPDEYKKHVEVCLLYPTTILANSEYRHHARVQTTFKCAQDGVVIPAEMGPSGLAGAKVLTWCNPDGMVLMQIANLSNEDILLSERTLVGHYTTAVEETAEAYHVRKVAWSPNNLE